MPYVVAKGSPTTTILATNGVTPLNLAKHNKCGEPLSPSFSPHQFPKTSPQHFPRSNGVENFDTGWEENQGLQSIFFALESENEFCRKRRTKRIFMSIPHNVVPVMAPVT